MAVIEYDGYKQKLLAMDETFENLYKALEIESARHEIERLELEAHEEGFWNDLERSQKNQMRSTSFQKPSCSVSICSSESSFRADSIFSACSSSLRVGSSVSSFCL